MRVVVVGAGIAGLALAGSLQRTGHEVVVLEEAGQLRTGGAAISVWHNGAAALRCLGTELDPPGRVIDLLEFWSSRGRRIGWIDCRRLSDRFGVEPVTIPRGELLQHLWGALDTGTVRFGAACRSVHERTDVVEVRTVDDEVVEADLVVGADGHRSVVRHLFAPDVPAQPTGWASLQGLTETPLPITEGRTSIYCAGRAGGVGIMPAGRGLLQWWFDMPWPPAAPTAPILSQVRQRFGHWKGPVRELLSLVDESDIEPYPHAWHRIPKSFCSSRVALIGDAVHAIPPVLAQGANQSIEDAWVLARELQTAPTVPQALARYQAERRRKVSMVSRAARGPALPLYGAASLMPRRIPVVTERFCTFAWRMVLQSASSTIPLARTSR